MPNATGVGKLKRSYYLTYIDSSFGGQTPSWFLIGKHIQDMSVELNPDTQVIKNILDETVTEDNGYQPIKDIMMNRKTGDDCKTKVLEVLIDKTEGPFDAWQEDCVVKPQSYGGAQGAVNIPYNITFDGNRQQGTATLANKVPTFTAA